MSQNTSSAETVYDVFLSYAHADAELYGKDLIQSIKQEIQNEIQDVSCRHLVFLDSEALELGDEWEAKIKEKLQECRQDVPDDLLLEVGAVYYDNNKYIDGVLDSFDRIDIECKLDRKGTDSKHYKKKRMRSLGLCRQETDTTNNKHIK